MRKPFITSASSALSVLVLVAALLASVFVINRSKYSAESCDISNNACIVTVGQNEFKVEFTQVPKIEERLNLMITGEPPFTVKDVSIRGVNMYMGVITVIEHHSTDTKWEGWTLLGACSEPNMIWQLTFHIEMDSIMHTKRLSFKTFS